MKTSKTTLAMGLALALVGTGGFLSGRATAEDPMEGMPPAQKPVDGHALVKALTGKWSLKGKSPMGESTGTVTWSLACGNTVLLEDYASKSPMGDFRGLGVQKLAADGKSGTIWWFDTHGDSPTQLTGKVSDTGYEMEGNTPQGPMKVTLAQKGETFEFRLQMGEMEMVDTYTRVK